MKRADWHFLLRRLHGVSGIVPIGAFLLEHWFTNAHVTVSAEEWTHAAHKIQSLPFLWVLEIGFIALPLTFHALYGFYIWHEGRGNATQYSYFQNWMYFLQRVSGLVLFAYIGYHVYETRIQWLLGGPYPGARYMHDYFNSGFNTPIYYLGVAAASFHFANGLWNVSCKWGVAITPQAQRLVGAACAGLCAALLITGVVIVNTFKGLAEPEMKKADKAQMAAALKAVPPAVVAQDVIESGGEK